MQYRFVVNSGALSMYATVYEINNFALHYSDALGLLSSGLMELG